MYDVFEPWAKAVPPELRQLLDSGDKKDFDRFFEEAMKEATPTERQNWEWRAKPYGLQSRLMCSPPPASTTSPI